MIIQNHGRLFMSHFYKKIYGIYIIRYNIYIFLLLLFYHFDIIIVEVNYFNAFALLLQK